jgi:hypothetical protein
MALYVEVSSARVHSRLGLALHSCKNPKIALGAPYRDYVSLAVSLEEGCVSNIFRAGLGSGLLRYVPDSQREKCNRIYRILEPAVG